MKGKLLILSGPSGVGKSTIHSIFKKNNADFKLSVSVTTRAPRAGEVEGVNYYYKSEAEFERLIKENAFIEYVEFSGHHYGTLKTEIARITSGGDNVVLDVEAVGALNIKKEYPSAILVFILPTSFEDLSRRLTSRASETQDELKARMATFKEQLSYATQYDYVVVNDDKERCAKDLQDILDNEKQGKQLDRLKVENNLDLIEKIIREV